MNKVTATKIQKAAKFLSTPIAQQAREYLDRPYKLALLIIDQFADGEAKDYEEIAEMTGLNFATVTQVIKALERGGYPLQFTFAALKVKTGRKPVTVRKSTKTLLN